MKKINIKESKQNPHFIGSWQIEPTSICEELINYFESNHAKQFPGGTERGINKDVKDSIDISFKPKDINLQGNESFKVYFDQLFECYKNYIEEWPFLKTMTPELEIGYFNLQKYNPGQHFKNIHTERSSIETLHRIFAFMTYLNDVEEGGSTFFSHYDLEIQPQKGLTLIWPAEWTHAHRGNILRKGSKYIITGWLNFTSIN